MNRPKWCPADTWEKIVRSYNRDGRLICDHPTCTDPAEHLDHIVPRSEGGETIASNLQPLCAYHNLKKNNRADRYWRGRMYFDQDINRERLRVSQGDFIIGPIERHAEFFGQPADNINGKLFTFAQIVSAGKTLGAFSIPFAINSAVRRRNLAAPRVDRMLLITKSQQIRDQMGNELQLEPTRFRIVDQPPRVRVIRQSSQLQSDDADYDIAVMCPNMLWPEVDVTADGTSTSVRYVEGYERILRRHPLIVFDEMHYAFAKIQQLVRHAGQSLVFGLTGTPIDAAGSLLDDIVLMSVYGYGDAVRNDGSLKSMG